MEIRWLQDFLTLAEVGNFTRAADERHISQAAFSRRIQQLEAWMAVKLIDRGAFPARLTPEGMQFRDHASEILRRAMQARSELGSPYIPGRIRIAIPNVLAATRLPAWWRVWSGDDASSCAIELGNVHDLVTSFVSGAVDLLVCFHSAQQPTPLDSARFERCLLANDRLMPAAHRGIIDYLGWPGCAERPVPLIMHTPNVYFGQLVDSVVEASPFALYGKRVIECEMTEVLRAMALAGYGVAWLPESSLRSAACSALAPIGDDSWTAALSIVAFRNRSGAGSAVLDRVWSRIVESSQTRIPKTRRRSSRAHTNGHFASTKTGAQP